MKICIFVTLLVGSGNFFFVFAQGVRLNRWSYCFVSAAVFLVLFFFSVMGEGNCLPTCVLCMRLMSMCPWAVVLSVEFQCCCCW